MKNYARLILSIMVCHLAGVAGSLITRASIREWYPYIKKPFFNPPNWVFGPVWFLLYTCIGVAFYLVLKNEKTTVKKSSAILLFLIQLAVNTSWSFGFFGLRSPFLGLLIIIALWLLIIKTIYFFSDISRTAAYLLVPYFAWVSFAFILNLFIFVLN